MIYILPSEQKQVHTESKVMWKHKVQSLLHVLNINYSPLKSEQLGLENSDLHSLHCFLKEFV